MNSNTKMYDANEVQLFLERLRLHVNEGGLVNLLVVHVFTYHVHISVNRHLMSTMVVSVSSTNALVVESS